MPIAHIVIIPSSNLVRSIVIRLLWRPEELANPREVDQLTTLVSHYHLRHEANSSNLHPFSQRKQIGRSQQRCSSPPMTKPPPPGERPSGSSMRSPPAQPPPTPDQAIRDLARQQSNRSTSTRSDTNTTPSSSTPSTSTAHMRKSSSTSGNDNISTMLTSFMHLQSIRDKAYMETIQELQK